MRSRPERGGLLAAAVLPLLATCALAATASDAAKGPTGPNPLGFSGFGGKEPVTVVADRLEYDYKAGVVVYRGSVEVTQGATTLKSDTLTVTLAQDANAKGKKPADSASNAAGDAVAQAAPASAAPSGAPSDPLAGGAARVQEIVATGSVRIDQGDRFATGGRAVFDQTKRTVVLTEDPVLHDGPNEVMGDRVVVFIDENRSVVEGGRKRVKAVLYPNQNDGKPQGGNAKPAAGSPHQ